MPDLATHMVIPYIFLRAFKARNILYILWGCVLPDLLARVPMMFSPRAYFGFFHGMHTPLASLILCYALSLLFEIHLRRKVFVCLVLGAALHFLFDTLQINESGLPLFWLPFSTKPLAAGLFWPEDPLYLLGFWLLILSLIILLDWRQKQKATAGEKS